MMQLLWKTLWWFLKKLKIELAYDPASPLLDIYNTKELKVGSQRGMYTHVLSSVIYNNQNVEVTQVPMDGRMDTQSVAYTNNEKKKVAQGLSKLTLSDLPPRMGSSRKSNC